MKTIIILDQTQGTVYYYNISASQIKDIEIFLNDKDIDCTNCTYMIVDELITFDNRINK